MATDSKKRLKILSKRSLTVFGIATLIVSGGLLISDQPAAEALSTLEAAELEMVSNPEQMLMSSPFEVSEYGYTELEYFASGEARMFLNADGSVMGPSAAEPLTTAEVGAVAGDYKTRVIIRKPAAAAFNGTMVVEWTNVTTGQDGEFGFGEVYDKILSDGYAVAVVSVRNPGVTNLVTNDPVRYGSLKLNTECAEDIICPSGTMAWDIMGQVSKALKESPESPFADLDREVENVIALGQSGSAVALSTYYNKIQPIHDFFDGIVFWDYAGVLREDLDTPGVSLHSWTFQAPQPTSSEMTRRWEVAGAAHGSWYVNEYMEKMFLRDGTQPAGQGFYEWLMTQGDYVNGGVPCANPNLGTKVRVGHAIGAAIDSVDTWSRGGQAAAPSIYFERDSSGTIIHDENGVVKGGLRLADAVVPTVKNELNSGGWTCGAAGGWNDYTAQELEQMYVSHDAYVSQVTEVTLDNLQAGYITQHDADLTIAEAAASDVAHTDLGLISSVSASSGIPGATVTLGLTPTVNRGAWLETNGSKVPVVVSGTATFVPAGESTRSAGEVLWSGTATLAGETALDNAGELTLPASVSGGTVTVQWCIETGLQSAEFAGHVNATCGDGGASNSTITVAASVVNTDGPGTSTTPDAGEKPGSEAGATAAKPLATTGNEGIQSGVLAAFGVLLVASSATLFAIRRLRKTADI